MVGAISKVMYDGNLFRYILNFLPRNSLRLFIRVSKDHRDFVQEFYISEYISYLKGYSSIPHHRIIEPLNTMVVSKKLKRFIRSNTFIHEVQRANTSSIPKLCE
jgi:hypothetical protein